MATEKFLWVVNYEDLADFVQNFWTQAGGDRGKIVPMAGELASSSAAEVRTYAREAATQQIDQLHFYTYEDAVKGPVWNAVASA